MVSDRQSKILNAIVREYISCAQPISSRLLEKKGKFDICPATIRNEMQELTDSGFLCQPHTSAGRVPTDKGYRFFVDNLFEEKLLKEDLILSEYLEKDHLDTIKLIHLVTKALADESPDLILSYLFDKRISWREGWENLLMEPEFKEKQYLIGFTDFIKDFEEKISETEFECLRICIGKENPFSKAKDFSIIFSECSFSDSQKGVLAIMGPKRMDFARNISLINSAVKIFQNYFFYGKRTQEKN